MITSQITARPVFSVNPIGFIPLVPLNNGYAQYVGQTTIKIKIEYSVFQPSFVLNDIPATQANFLAAVKTEIDTNYLPTVFTDATKDYETEITVTAIKLDFESATSDRGIWTERTYYYYVDVVLRTNVI